MSNETASTNKPKSKKSNCFCMMLYPDNMAHQTFVDIIIKDLGLVWYGILHDQDLYASDVLDDDGNILYKIGEKKKDHWHIMVFTPYTMSLSAFRDSMKYYEIEPNLCDTCNKYFYTRYLTHIAYRHTLHVNCDKHYYDESKIIGNRNKFFEYYSPVSSEETQRNIWEVLQHIALDDKHYTLISALRVLDEYGLREIVMNNSAYFRTLQQIIIEKRGKINEICSKSRNE